MNRKLYLTMSLWLTLFSFALANTSLASESGVYRFTDQSEVAGAYSQLTRMDGMVAAELVTSGLEPMTPYTLWWVVFNRPENCLEACDEDDIFNADGTLNLNPAADISILFADGAMTSVTGGVSFSAVLPEGRTLGEVVVGHGLQDAENAEIHLVVRYHGALEATRAYEQLSTFEPSPVLGGSCTDCSDVQFAVHQPTSLGERQPAESSVATMHDSASRDEIPFAYSTLIRTDEGIAMDLQTDDLEPNAPYTVWWVVFNTPEGCSEACNADDVSGENGPNPDAGVSVLWATSNVSDAHGRSVFSAYLPEGQPLGQVTVGSGLEDARNAEVHLVIRSHGAADMDRLYTQLNSFEPTPDKGGTCEVCANVQFSIHMPSNFLASNLVGN